MGGEGGYCGFLYICVPVAGDMQPGPQADGCLLCSKRCQIVSWLMPVYGVVALCAVQAACSTAGDQAAVHAEAAGVGCGA